jgi:hypothetical protein
MLFLLCDLLRSLVANSSFWVAACRPVPSASFRGQWPPVFGGVGRPERAFEDCGGDVLSWAAARRTQFGPGCHIARVSGLFDFTARQESLPSLAMMGGATSPLPSPPLRGGEGDGTAPQERRPTKLAMMGGATSPPPSPPLRGGEGDGTAPQERRPTGRELAKGLGVVARRARRRILEKIGLDKKHQMG